MENLTPDEQLLLKNYRELQAEPDLQLPFIENVSASFTTDAGLKIELTVSKSRD